MDPIIPCALNNGMEMTTGRGSEWIKYSPVFLSRVLRSILFPNCAAVLERQTYLYSGTDHDRLAFFSRLILVEVVLVRILILIFFSFSFHPCFSAIPTFPSPFRFILSRHLTLKTWT